MKNDDRSSRLAHHLLSFESLAVFFKTLAGSDPEGLHAGSVFFFVMNQIMQEERNLQ